MNTNITLQAQAGAELSDIELEAMSGGAFFANVREFLCRDRTDIAIRDDGTYTVATNTSTKTHVDERGTWVVW